MMMRSLALTAAVGAVTAARTDAQNEVLLQAPTPPTPRWGGNATTMSFVAGINMTDISDSPEGPTWSFRYTYDGSRNSSRYDHGPGQHDEVCKSINKVSVHWSPCSALLARRLAPILNPTRSLPQGPHG